MMRLRIKIVSLLYSLLLFVPVYAMESLNDEALADESGQAGADLTLKFKTNHDNNDGFSCADLIYCRLGLSLNNRYHDGSQDSYDGSGNRVQSTTGKKQWLVFKGIQGTINIQELKFDGEDVVYGTTTKGSLKFGFTSTKPIEIRNLGFNSLSIETDTVANEGTGNLPGYLVSSASPGTYTGFDAGREKGFLGLNVNTNLSLTGSIKMFSCSSANSHPRC